MTRMLAACLMLLLAACGDQPAPKAEKKPAEAKAAEIQPAPASPVPQKADPNKALAERVKKALQDEAKIHAAGIDVTAADGVVTLWGTAASAEERTRAAKTAAAVEGVKSVENKLAVVKGS